MKWEHVLTLLHIAHMANDYPQLHKIRDAAVAHLAAADANALHFSDQVEEVEEDE